MHARLVRSEQKKNHHNHYLMCNVEIEFGGHATIKRKEVGKTKGTRFVVDSRPQIDDIFLNSKEFSFQTLVLKTREVRFSQELKNKELKTHVDHTLMISYD
eukprot:GHVO01046952.1.p1 GENE.GHVO01046952.1~~GHVO01046952.1.p1  ORF type:complete len:101 (-),score=2.63 GHVO01046952.1:322-624(-)